MLGYDLTPDQERDEADHHHSSQCAGWGTQLMGGPTFEQFSGHYLAFLQSKKLKDLGRPTTTVKKHLVPLFGSLPLVSMQLHHGLRYLEHLRSQQAAEGTIEREYGVARDAGSCGGHRRSRQEPTGTTADSAWSEA